MEKLTLSVTAEEINIIAEGLALLPYKFSVKLINDLQVQINEQSVKQKENEQI